MSFRKSRPFSYLFTLVFGMLTAACSNVTGDRVTNETRSAIAARVAASSLSTDDKAVFSSANQRAENGDYDVTDKTVGQIISVERAFESQRAADEAQAAKLVADARAKKAALERQLQSALSVGLVSKGFHDADYTNQEYQSKILITFVLKNRGKKAIRSFKGVTHFQNSVGDDIRAVSFVYEQGLMPGESALYNATLDFNQFEQSAVQLKEAELRNIHLRWEPQVIVFDDGSRLVADSSGS